MFSIISKDLKLFITDKRSVLLTFLMPMVLITVFALAFGRNSSGDSDPVTVYISDKDQTPVSSTYILQLDSIKEVDLITIEADTGRQKISAGKLTSMIILEKGFSDSLLSSKSVPVTYVYDESKAIEANIAGQIVQFFTQRFVQYYNENKTAQLQLPLPDSAQNMQIKKYILETLKSNNIQLKSESVQGKKKKSPGLIQAVAGTAVMMLLFSVTALGAGILEEKENGTLKRIFYTPLNPYHLLWAKMTTANLVAMAQLFVMFIYANILFGLEIGTNIPALIIMVFCTAFACSSFGVFLASVAKTRQQVQAYSTLIILSMSVLGGSMVPLFLMPGWIQNIAVVSVNYWSIQGFYDIFWRELPFDSYTFLMKPFTLLLIGIIMLSVSAFFYKKNIIQKLY